MRQCLKINELLLRALSLYKSSQEFMITAFHENLKPKITKCMDHLNKFLNKIWLYGLLCSACLPWCKKTSWRREVCFFLCQVRFFDFPNYGHLPLGKSNGFHSFFEQNRVLIAHCAVPPCTVREQAGEGRHASSAREDFSTFWCTLPWHFENQMDSASVFEQNRF